MNIPTKVGAGLVVLGGASLGGYGIHSWMNGMPSYDLLCQESGFTKKDYIADTKIGKKYSYFFVGTFGKTTSTELVEKEKNKKWWAWSYKNWKRDSEKEQTGNYTLSESFAKGKVSVDYVSSQPSLSTNPKALNLVCEDIYKEDVTTIEGLDDNSSKKKRDLFKYCSPMGQEPKTLSPDTSNYKTPDTHGASKTNRTKLVDPYDSSNKVFWELRNKEFFGEYSSDNKGTGHSVDDTNSVFKNLYTTKGTSRQGNIKNICKKAYDLKETAETNDSERASSANVLKFCSLKGS